MIPKIIHYCWFGRGPKPVDVTRNIEGWRRLHPDFQIIEWNEENFDINVCDYVREAYTNRKFAYVSDYARGLALLEHGGVYLDCDVELVGHLDAFLGHAAFWGFEANDYVATSTIGCAPGYSLMRDYLNQYHQRKFLKPDGAFDLTTNVIVVNNLLEKVGLVRNGKKQILADQSIVYPMQVFSPLDYIMHVDYRCATTVAVHHYQHTWGTPWDRIRKNISKCMAAILGEKFFTKLKKCLRK